MICEVLIKVESASNKREHWSIKHAREKAQKLAIRTNLVTVLKKDLELPVVIKLTRVAPRPFDYDNLVAGMKHVVDCIADILKPGLAAGRADSSEDMKFVYEQVKGKPREYKLLIEVIEKDHSFII